MQMGQQLGRDRLDGLSQESGEPLWAIWVIPATLACAVVHITLTAGHVIIGLFHC